MIAYDPQYNRPLRDHEHIYPDLKIDQDIFEYGSPNGDARYWEGPHEHDAACDY